MREKRPPFFGVNLVFLRRIEFFMASIERCKSHATLCQNRRRTFGFNHLREFRPPRTLSKNAAKRKKIVSFVKNFGTPGFVLIYPPPPPPRFFSFFPAAAAAAA